MNRYEPSAPRTIIAFAAVFMTVATLAGAVLAPATMDLGTGDAGAREVSIVTTTNELRHAAPTGAADATTSINVVAKRSTRLVPAVQTRAQLRGGASG